MKVIRRSPEIWLLVPVLLFMGVIYIYPVGSMLSTSVLGPDGLGLSEYKRVFESDTYLRVFVQSLEISGWVTLMSLLVGYPFAYFIVYSKRKVLWFGLVLMSMWLGIIIRSYGWMGVLGENGVFNFIIGLVSDNTSSWLYSQAAVVIGMVHILMPFMILPLFSVMRGIPENTLRASKTLGASNFYTFVRVYVPLSMPGMLAGSLLVFIQSIGFYITPALIGGRDQIMIAQLIEVQVNELLNWPFASALSSLLVIITVLSLLIVSRVVPLRLLWGGR